MPGGDGLTAAMVMEKLANVVADAKIYTMHAQPGAKDHVAVPASHVIQVDERTMFIVSVTPVEPQPSRNEQLVPVSHAPDSSGTKPTLPDGQVILTMCELPPKVDGSYFMAAAWAGVVLLELIDRRIPYDFGLGLCRNGGQDLCVAVPPAREQEVDAMIDRAHSAVVATLRNAGLSKGE